MALLHSILNMSDLDTAHMQLYFCFLDIVLNFISENNFPQCSMRTVTDIMAFLLIFRCYCCCRL